MAVIVIDNPFHKFKLVIAPRKHSGLAASHG